jgi:hypothetical protein
MKKFSAGGAQGRYDRRMADIEKDYAKAMTRKTGRAAEVAEAKRQQRIADAKDDLAKRTGADRTATRAAERAAESNLKKTRKYGAPKAVTQEKPAAKVTDTLGPITAPKSGLATSAKTPTKTPTKTPVKAETKPTRMGDQGFAYKKKDMATTGDGVSTHRRYVRGGSNSGAAADGTAAKRLEAKGLKTGAKTDTKTTGPSTKTGLNPNSIAGMLARGNIPNPFKGLRLTTEEDMKARYARQAEGKAKGGKIMKYAKGGSTPPKPSAADRARSKKHLDELKKLKPSAAEGKVVASANRSEGPGYKKGGSMASCGMKKGGKAKAKPFAATKFGAAMKKKSADTKGRAMMKFAKGGSIDGCAVKGKTKTSMVKMKNGGSC